MVKIKHLNKIGAVIVKMYNVDYAPDGQFTTFENGMLCLCILK